MFRKFLIHWINYDSSQKDADIIITFYVIINNSPKPGKFAALFIYRSGNAMSKVKVHSSYFLQIARIMEWLPHLQKSNQKKKKTR